MSFGRKGPLAGLDAAERKAAERIASVARDVEGLMVVVTGAGISLASGIPTFRGDDPAAVWSKDVTELGTMDFFWREPVESWRWYLTRFSQLLGKRPNASHEALAALERWQLKRGGDWLLVTQNIDGLHRQAGSERLIEVHGRGDRVRCAAPSDCRFGAPTGSLPRPMEAQRAFLAEPSLDRVPRCPACGELLRQHVLWFDERYDSHDDYRWQDVLDVLERLQAVLFVGTSFSVGVTELVMRAARHGGVPALSLDPHARSQDGLELLPARAERVLPAVAALLK